MATVLQEMKQRILAVDDEPDALELIEFNLKQAGFDVFTADSGKAAIAKARQVTPNLVLLDLMLPEIDGLEICKALRRDPATSNVPIIMLTARTAEVDRVLGLELGADDYVTKPFSPRELILRIKNLLRRGKQEGGQEEIRVGDILINLPRHQLYYKGKSVELTATEFKLAATLASRCGRVQSREQLLREVWDYSGSMDTRTVDTHVRRLREKLGDAAAYLDTVRGVGYRFVDV
jgi:two-component system phosphate regulon response regulator PhoB